MNILTGREGETPSFPALLPYGQLRHQERPWRCRGA